MEDLGWEDLGMRRGRGLAGGWQGARRGLAGGWQGVGGAGTLFGRAATDSHAQAIHCVASAGEEFCLNFGKKNE